MTFNKADYGACRIVAVILARNEERTIRETVESASRYVHNVVMMDGRSTDRTAAIAREAGASVYIDKGKGKGAPQAPATLESTNNPHGNWVDTTNYVRRAARRLTRIRARETEADADHLLEAFLLLIFDPLAIDRDDQITAQHNSRVAEVGRFAAAFQAGAFGGSARYSLNDE